MIIYAENISNRLRYVSEFVASELLNERITLTNDKEVFSQHIGIKINYSQDKVADDEFHLPPHSLLFENYISAQQINCTLVSGKKVFFQTTTGDFHFDVLAATFYLLTRYEEYLPHEKDQYGRFPHTASLAFKEGFLHIPLINCWLDEFKEALQKKNPSFQFHHKTFSFLPTYDIDMAWKYKHKGFWRNIGSGFKSIFKNEKPNFGDRIAVLQESKKDPYDIYEWLDALHLYCRMKPYYFFLVAEEQKAYDKNIPPSNEQLQQLIAYHSGRGIVGIHPSWQSGDDPKLIKQELGWLEFITGNKIKHSRQHYIRLNLPNTFRELISAGIEKDFSIGYGSTNGFRASVASSFFWYDLEKEASTDLVLFPFCFMDANAYYEEKLTPHQAFNELMNYYYQIKKVNGMMITIWHNNFLSTEKQFSPWRDMYEIFLKEEVYWDS